MVDIEKMSVAELMSAAKQLEAIETGVSDYELFAEAVLREPEEFSELACTYAANLREFDPEHYADLLQSVIDSKIRFNEVPLSVYPDATEAAYETMEREAALDAANELDEAETELDEAVAVETIADVSSAADAKDEGIDVPVYDGSTKPRPFPVVGFELHSEADEDLVGSMLDEKEH